MKNNLIKSIVNNDRRALAKALTIVESTAHGDILSTEAIISSLPPYKSMKSKVIGFSGITGSGKSSLIEELGKKLLVDNKKVAVLAIDPSSPIHGGSILGDKTRMDILSSHPNCFVRPVPSKNQNGGVSRSSQEAILIFNAAGYDYIFIETVGVGQAEHNVHRLCDCLILNLLPATGDELQGVKKGINELADIILINKSDGALKTQAEITANEYKKTLSIPIISTSIFEQKSIEKILSLISDFFINGNNKIEKKRASNYQHWVRTLAHNKILSSLSEIKINEEISNPYKAKEILIRKLKDIL